ncbi:hypothetical protein [Paraburkholderia guartelaensis]|uniref:Uncharacterized protein n=1 Tax=Paraburkholderia guartelaensis TaxID=2546446 RepID=A0ABU9SLI0_9BURK
MTPAAHTTPDDAALLAAIKAAAETLRFDNRPGSLQRQCTLGLFVAALSDQLALAFPASAGALHALVFSPSTSGNPTETSKQQPL